MHTSNQIRIRSRKEGIDPESWRIDHVLFWENFRPFTHHPTSSLKFNFSSQKIYSFRPCVKGMWFGRKIKIAISHEYVSYVLATRFPAGFLYKQDRDLFHRWKCDVGFFTHSFGSVGESQFNDGFDRVVSTGSLAYIFCDAWTTWLLIASVRFRFWRRQLMGVVNRL